MLDAHIALEVIGCHMWIYIYSWKIWTWLVQINFVRNVWCL